ncbi:hypothetical protein BCY84_00527 [Trypanosoma cruzi cruzi]|nr:hypothetical protein BCY84_00527 [Trypanosoma cruzi cruzi]
MESENSPGSRVVAPLCDADNPPVEAPQLLACEMAEEGGGGGAVDAPPERRRKPDVGDDDYKWPKMLAVRFSPCFTKFSWDPYAPVIKSTDVDRVRNCYKRTTIPFSDLSLERQKHELQEWKEMARRNLGHKTQDQPPPPPPPPAPLPPKKKKHQNRKQKQQRQQQRQQQEQQPHYYRQNRMPWYQQRYNYWQQEHQQPGQHMDPRWKGHHNQDIQQREFQFVQRCDRRGFFPTYEAASIYHWPAGGVGSMYP